MRVLLDTNALLWWLYDLPQLGPRARATLADPANERFVSAVSIWEIRLKSSLGKLTVAPNFFEALLREPFAILDVTARHANLIGDLPFHHRDPFDRLLIAQAMV